MTVSLWLVFVAFQSIKLCVIDQNHVFKFLIQIGLWSVDTIAAVYISTFVENKTVWYWLWFSTNALQTLLYEPLLKRTLHFHHVVPQPPSSKLIQTIPNNMTPLKPEDEYRKQIIHKYRIITLLYYTLHAIHILFMFLVVFFAFSSPPAELNIAIAFTFIGSFVSCVTMEMAQTELNKL
jgi:hypothetical protein